MRRLGVLVCALMAAVLLWTGTSARAAEIAGCIEVGGETAGHFEDGDKGQVPSDPDKGAPHHHGGCHLHHVTVPFDGEAAPFDGRLNDSIGLRRAQFTAGCDPGTQLRPPIA